MLNFSKSIKPHFSEYKDFKPLPSIGEKEEKQAINKAVDAIVKNRKLVEEHLRKSR